ncbi:MAG: histidine kinase, partial [Clostridium sp.]
METSNIKNEKIKKIRKENLRRYWLRKSLNQKMKFYVAAIISLLVVAIGISFGLLYSYLSDFNTILKNNNYNQRLNAAFEKQVETYHNYTSLKNDTNKFAYQEASIEVKEALDRLPEDLTTMSKERYLITCSIKNTYEAYQRQMAHVLLIERGTEVFIRELYDSLDMQGYLQEYIHKLTKVTLRENDDIYSQKLEFFNKMPSVLILLALVAVIFIIVVGRSIVQLVLNPVMKLAEAAERITAEEYDVPDVVVENEDEIGQLVQAFNSMKHSTAKAINTLKEKNEIESKFHKEEVKRINMEKMVDAMKMRLLQNQIRPHFLFNTLNIISGMARLEGADTTREMTMSLSKLLRYNLKTDSDVVYLSSELGVIKDYIYIQEKRFGARIKFQLNVDEKVDEHLTKIPTFTLQPLVENAIIHGVGPKEEGGTVKIEIIKKNEELHIIVADSGMGMSKEKLKVINEELNNGGGEN